LQNESNAETTGALFTFAHHHKKGLNPVPSSETVLTTYLWRCIQFLHENKQKRSGFPGAKTRHGVVIAEAPPRLAQGSGGRFSEVSPVPGGAGYTFNVAPERQAWVESKVRSAPSPNGRAAWIIHIQQLGHLTQQIQLELLGDGITGIVYEAGPEGIVPLRSRLAGPARAFVILAVNLLLWGGFWLLVRLIPRVLGARYRQRATTGLTRRV
jgi:hypothetical protein